MNPTFSLNDDRRWMLVDDNPEILTMFSAEPGRYDLVITDFEMPGMDGVELCRRLQAISPGQKIFLATGSGFFSETAAGHYGFSALLNKPFPLMILQEKLVAAGLLEAAACAV
jgi:CheY-like chemotaxis protein